MPDPVVMVRGDYYSSVELTDFYWAVAVDWWVECSREHGSESGGSYLGDEPVLQFCAAEFDPGEVHAGLSRPDGLVRGRDVVPEELSTGRYLVVPAVDVAAIPSAEHAGAEGILQAAGFTHVTFTDVHEPVYYGSTATSALAWVRGFISTNELLKRLDPAAATLALQRLRQVLAAHLTDDGVWFDSRALGGHRPSPMTATHRVPRAT